MSNGIYRPWACKVPVPGAPYGFAKDSEEAKNNALCCLEYLSPKGWTKNAIAAMLGNVGHEGVYNPWSWEGNIVLNSTDYAGMASNIHGYGLFGYTPSEKYLRSAKAATFYGFQPLFNDKPGGRYDGYAQLEFIDGVPGNWNPRLGFNLTFREFITSTADVRYLASAWMREFENPASYDTETVRQNDAEYWLDWLKDKPARRVPAWLLFQFRR